jgi:hypothetical protein
MTLPLKDNMVMDVEGKRETHISGRSRPTGAVVPSPPPPPPTPGPWPAARTAHSKKTGLRQLAGNRL